MTGITCHTFTLSPGLKNELGELRVTLWRPHSILKFLGEQDAVDST